VKSVDIFRDERGDFTVEYGEMTEEAWWTWPPLGYTVSENLLSICGLEWQGELKDKWFG
jgi:hypothetical protein